MMNDYIDLGPDAVIREGDEWSRIENDPGIYWPIYSITHTPFKEHGEPFIGRKAKDFKMMKFRRLRSVAIRDAAMALLVDYYQSIPDGVETWPICESLREALGVSVEELREP